jgi:hypothetical protein
LDWLSKWFLKFPLYLLIFSLSISTVQAKENVTVSKQSQCFSRSTVELKDELRKLWFEHAVWTRNYIVSAVGDLDDQEKVLARLLINQEDIGNAIKPYYGEKAGNQLTELLKEHIVVGGKVIEAVKSGNQEDLKKYNTEWYRNADDIAQFLSSANPNWNNNVLKDLLHVHLQMVTDDVVARLKKDWDASIIAFDKGEVHLLHLADTLTEGILKQFPKQF